MGMKESRHLGQLGAVMASPTVSLGPEPVATAEHVDFHALFDAQYDFVCRILHYANVPPSAVEDAAQDVFVTLHRRLPEWDGKRDLRNWLWGIARGVARTYRRSAARSRRKRGPSLVPPPSPLERVEQRERAAFVQRFLEMLGEGHRDVFTLMEIEGLSAPEVATMLSLKVNTVYSRHRVARERFQAALQSEHEEGAHE